MTKTTERIKNIIQTLRVATAGFSEPAVTQIIRAYGKKPFLILVSCLLSLRTKDTVSLPVSKALFEKAQTPEQMLALTIGELEKILYPVGFFRQKAKTVRYVSAELIKRFDSKVPKTEQELLSLKGVGRKTANLVLGEAFGIPAICVDIHVHRISNRLGLVTSTTPEQTEVQLKKLLPRRYWIEWNRLLVMWGQNVCLPRCPRCFECAISQWCSWPEKRGVARLSGVVKDEDG